MLLHIDNLREYNWLEISFEIAKTLNSIYEIDRKPIENDHILMHFLKSMSKAHLLQYVMRIQSLITL